MSVAAGSPVTVLCMLLLSFEALVSMVINVFIEFVVLRDYYTKRSLTPTQKILAALNISSFFFVVVSSFNVFCNIQMPNFSRSSYYNVIFTLLFIYCMCSGSLLTAVLCFYYFIKVVNVQRGYLGWVKKKISSIVPWQITLVKLFSFANSLLGLLLFAPKQLSSTNNSLIVSTSETSEQPYVGYNYNIAKILSFMTFLPLFCTALSTLLTVGFLKLHSRKVKNTQISGEASLALYNSVIYRMMRFLLLYFVFYLVTLLYYFSAFSPHSPGYYINLMLMFFITPTQSVLHILDNQDLRRSWMRMVGWIIQGCVN
ncbi:taste receptor type 2 member 40-like [Dendrobates tinctorius]|uniref:taste receptor type 2 member 40-like n=1 Tax=Dendrobates tinctorius TaxID=92724 RepID=UPI003CC927B8